MALAQTQIGRRVFQWHIGLDRGQLTIEWQSRQRFPQALSDLATYFSCIRDYSIKAVVFAQPLGRSLWPALGHAGDVVHRIAHQRKVINDLVRANAKLLDHRFVGIQPASTHGVHQHDVWAHQLCHVLVPSGDGHVDALRRSLQRQRADHIVGFDARHAQDRETKRGNQLQQRLDLHPQVVWHRWPIGLVLRIDFIAECLSGRIHHEGGVLRPLLQVSAQHVDHAKHRACREAIGRSQLASLRLDGVIGAIEVVVTVNQYESGHGRILPPCSPALSVAGA